MPSQNLLEAPAQHLGLPAPAKGIKGYLPAPAHSSTGSVTPELAAANNNFFTVRPDLKGKGNIVHTTHTPESIANGYSIGSNAKITGNLNGFPEVVSNKLGKFGLELNTNEFAKLSNKDSRFINKIITEGTDLQIKNLTADPRFQNVFAIA